MQREVHIFYADRLADELFPYIIPNHSITLNEGSEFPWESYMLNTAFRYTFLRGSLRNSLATI